MALNPDTLSPEPGGEQQTEALKRTNREFLEALGKTNINWREGTQQQFSAEQWGSNLRDLEAYVHTLIKDKDGKHVLVSPEAKTEMQELSNLIENACSNNPLELNFWPEDELYQKFNSRIANSSKSLAQQIQTTREGEVFPKTEIELRGALMRNFSRLWQTPRGKLEQLYAELDEVLGT